jgi:hypothetical protein
VLALFGPEFRVSVLNAAPLQKEIYREYRREQEGSKNA